MRTLRSNARVGIHRGGSILASLATIIIVSGLVLASPIALATHRSGLHIGSMHEASASEHWCVQPQTYGSTNWSTAASNITNAVYTAGSWDLRVWDPVYSGYKVDFVAHTATTCAGDPNRSVMWVEYHLYNDNTDNCGAKTCSIVLHTNRYNGPYGHLETGLALAQLYGPYTTAAELPGPPPYYLHQVNHETGHVLGLADGDGTCTPSSIMHSKAYQCSSDLSYPSSSDLTSVDGVANNQ